MITLQYNNDNEIYYINFSRVSDNIIMLSGDFQVKTNGFQFIRPDDEHWDYSDYKTIYQETEYGVMFSNDGSVYIPEPTAPDQEEPTEEEIKTAFENRKKNRIMESKMQLKVYLENNPIHSTCHGDRMGAYSITEEKQTLMMSQYMSYQIEKAVNPSAMITWNETGKPCEVWTEQEFLQLILEIKSTVYPLVTKQQEYEVQIMSCTTHDELNSIVIEYGGGYESQKDL